MDEAVIDRPILFSAPMVRALLAGTKTQTRRALYPSRDFAGDALPKTSAVWHTADRAFDPPPLVLGDPLIAGAKSRGWAINPLIKLKPGDRLWVKETWRTGFAWDGDPPSAIIAGSSVSYEADGEPMSGKVRVSIHMPKWASRMTLIVKSVRVERLQAISDDDCKAEGIGDPYLGDGDPPFIEETVMVSRWMQYRNLWGRINGPGSWLANPWVIVISFDVVKRNIRNIDAAR